MYIRLTPWMAWKTTRTITVWDASGWKEMTMCLLQTSLKVKKLKYPTFDITYLWRFIEDDAGILLSLRFSEFRLRLESTSVLRRKKHVFERLACGGGWHPNAMFSCWFNCTETDDTLLSVKSVARHPSADSHRSETSRGASPVNKPGLRSNNESYPDILSVLPASVASNLSIDSSK